MSKAEAIAAVQGLSTAARIAALIFLAKYPDTTINNAVSMGLLAANSRRPIG